MKKQKAIKNKQWLTLDEFATKAGVSRTTIDNRIFAGEIIFQYFGKNRSIKLIDSFKFNPLKFKIK